MRTGRLRYPTEPILDARPCSRAQFGLELSADGIDLGENVRGKILAPVA
jgi:hypothetical protein